MALRHRKNVRVADSPSNDEHWSGDDDTDCSHSDVEGVLIPGGSSDVEDMEVEYWCTKCKAIKRTIAPKKKKKKAIAKKSRKPTQKTPTNEDNNQMATTSSNKAKPVATKTTRSSQKTPPNKIPPNNKKAITKKSSK